MCDPLAKVMRQIEKNLRGLHNVRERLDAVSDLYTVQQAVLLIDLQAINKNEAEKLLQANQRIDAHVRD